MDVLGSNHKLRNTKWINLKTNKDHCKIYSDYQCTQCDEGYILKNSKCKLTNQNIKIKQERLIKKKEKARIQLNAYTGTKDKTKTP